MTWKQKIQLLKYEAELYELYVSKIEPIKDVLKSFNGRQVNVRITWSIQKEIPQDDCSIRADKEDRNLRICFSATKRAITVVSTHDNISKMVYTANNRDSILCVDAVRLGYFDYQAAEPQINKQAADWLNIAKEFKTTDYSGLLDEYKGIADTIKAFQEKVNFRILDLLGLEFRANNVS